MRRLLLVIPLLLASVLVATTFDPGCQSSSAQPTRPSGQPFGAAIFVTGNPNGKVQGPKGQIAADRATGDLYKNTNGSTAWTPLLTGIGGGTGTVGPGTTNKVARFTGASTIGDGSITDTGALLSTSTPIEMSTQATPSALSVFAYGTRAGIGLWGANGTTAAPTALTTDTQYAGIMSGGYHSGAAFSPGNGLITWSAANNWTNVSQGAYARLWVQAIGSTDRTSVLKLDHNGNIGVGDYDTVAGGSVPSRFTVKGSANTSALEGFLTVGNDATFEGSTCVINSLGITCSGTLMTPGADITGVTANAPISGGGTSGAVSVGLTNCAANQSYRMNVAGTAWECVTASSGITNGAGANVITKSDGTNLVASTVTDDGTTVAVATNKLTVATATGNTNVAGTFNATGVTTFGNTVDVASTLTVAASQLLDVKDRAQAKFISGDNTTPTIAACGTGSTIAALSNNLAGSFTTGTGVGACTMTFNGTWPHGVPWCFVYRMDTSVLAAHTATTTTLVPTSALSSTTYRYHCTGGQ